MGNAKPTGAESQSPESEQSLDRTEDRLDSWKEIAAYLKRDVRTVRRWEQNQGLPVRRHQHQKGASVYAYRSEVDAWWKGKEARLANETEPASEPTESEISVLPRSRVNWAAAGIAVLAIVAALTYFLRIPFSAKTSAAAPRKLMLVVLPFQNLTGESTQEFVSDGFTEEMITQIAGLQHDRLAVIARTSSMAYKGTSKPVSLIGQELGADYALEGSVRRWGDQVRVTAQLIRVDDQSHLWAQNYESNRRDILNLQSDIAQAIAQQINLQLLTPQNGITKANQKSVDPRAHELYLKGRYYLAQRSRDGLLKSVECFQQAVEHDPSYAAAYAGLADAYNLVAFYGLDISLNSVSQAKIAADKALQLDGSLAAAHAAQGYTNFMWQGDWSSAETDFQRALKLDDNYVSAHQWYGLYLAAKGRMDEAIYHMQFAKRLDPLSPAAHSGLAYTYYFARNYEQAVEHARIALKLNPNSIPAHGVLGWAYIEQKNYTQAIEELRSAAKLSGEVPVYLCGLARAHAQSGDVASAKKVLEPVKAIQTQPGGAGTALAAAYLSLGQTELALHWLEITAPGDIQANWLRVDPAFDSIRDNPRFMAVVNRIGTKTE